AVVAFGYAAAVEAIRHGSSGLLVPYGNDASFVRQSAILAGSLARARALGARAREEAAGRGWGEVVQQREAAPLIAAESGVTAAHAPSRIGARGQWGWKPIREQH